MPFVLFALAHSPILDAAFFHERHDSMITTVTGKNQVTIPADLARELNIKAGTQLAWSKDEDGALRAKPLPGRGELADRLQGLGRQWLKSGDDPVAELIEARVREDQEKGEP